MGSITRSFANNITTSGVLLPASLVNNSIANVTAYNAAVSTGGMVLVSSATASASATIDFTLGSYKEYQFYLINLHGSANSQFEFNLSTDNGSNYNVTKTTTFFAPVHAENDSEATLAYKTDYDLAQSTSNQKLDLGTHTANDQSLSGILQLFNPSSTTYVKHFIGVTNLMHDTEFGTVNPYIAGYANTTSALTNIRFIRPTGNIDEGTILMFGIV